MGTSEAVEREALLVIRELIAEGEFTPEEAKAITEKLGLVDA